MMSKKLINQTSGEITLVIKSLERLIAFPIVFEGRTTLILRIIVTLLEGC